MTKSIINYIYEMHHIDTKISIKQYNKNVYWRNGLMKIELCMGSSCFSRGNAQLLEQVEAYIEAHPELVLDLSGHLCLGDCSQGPNIRIDGTVHRGMKPDELIEKIRSRSKETDSVNVQRS